MPNSSATGHDQQENNLAAYHADASQEESSHQPDTAASCAQQELHNILTSRRQAYEVEPYRIVEDFRNEVSVTASYNGRQLLELLQNADDAARHQTTGPRRLLLRLSDHELLAANTGAPFSVKGIRSVLFANLSAKFGEPGYIGAKGLGFRALLNWSRRLRIDSGSLYVAFAPEVAHELLDQLRASHQDVRQILADELEPYPIAILRYPAECAAPLHADTEGYATRITLDLTETPPAVITDIEQQLSGLSAEVLVFLQHLDEVLIESPAGTRTLRCAGRGTASLRVGEAEEERTWQVFTHCAQFEDQSYQLKAAWNTAWAAETQSTTLHVFFPTRVSLPFPLLLHGPFELSSNRDFLVNDPAGLNAYLLGELVAFLVQVATDLRAGSGADRFAPLRLVWDRSQIIQHGLEKFDFAATLREHLRVAALWPRLDGSFGTQADTLYAARPFARYLPATSCPTLLMAPTSSTDELALNGLFKQVGSLPPLPLPTLLASIATARLAVPDDDYAQLLFLLTKRLQAERPVLAGHPLPPLFTGREQQALTATADDPVFLPPDEASPPAAQVPVRIMATSQAQALRAAFGVATFAELAEQLRSLHLRAYSFIELARALVLAHAHDSPQTLHPVLFQFFQAERRQSASSLPPAPATLAIPLLTLKDKRGRATTKEPVRFLSGQELYFGRAYGRELCEELYHYNLKGKIVASPDVLGLGAEPLEEVGEYLRWCGVADEPRLQRRQLTEGERRTYPEYVLQRFNYRESLGGERPNGFADLHEFRIGECWVTTLDDLPQLLQRSKRLATIMAWVQQSAEVSAQLARPKESTTSSLEVKYGTQYTYRKLPGRQMSNFLAWQFATLPWLQIDDYPERVAPARTVLSTTITREFRPHLFRLPTRDNRVPTGSHLFASAEVYKRALLRLGLRETIESVDVGLIYEVLYRLPTLDLEGKAAVSIYRELAENFTWQPEYAAHESYQQFCRHGQVWSRQEDIDQYRPVATVQYLTTADLAPTLRRQFQLLALTPEHRGDHIRQLLGVPPLPPLVLHVAGIPTPHPLQAKFNEDWYHLRPYIYAFRRGKSNREESLARLQKLRIQLCLTLPVAYKDEGKTHELELDNYRFLFPGKGNRRQVWWRVPATITTLEQLQQEADACEAVAQFVSFALDTTLDKAHYDLLFAASRAKREGIIRNKLPGLGTDGLAEVRRQLEGAVQTAADFWWQLARATGSRKPDPLPKAPETWPAWLGQRLPLGAALLPAILTDTDWAALANPEGLSVDELAPLCTLFRALGLELARFHRSGPIRLAFEGVFARELVQQRDTYRQPFETSLRTQLTGKEVSAQQHYLATIARYLNFAPVKELTLQEFPTQVWKRVVSREFGLSLDWSDSLAESPTTFSGNREHLIAYGETQHIPAYYTRSFLADDQQRSLLFFDQLEWLRQALRESYKPPATTTTSAAATDKVVQLGSLTYRYSSLDALRKELEQQPRSTGAITLLKPLAPAAPAAGTGTFRTSSRPGTNGAAQADKNGQTGFLGELFAYWRLCDLYGVANVVWESSNALAAGIALETAIDDSAGYDLRYRVSDTAQWRRVEVKSGWAAKPLTEFYLSAGELAAGRQWGHCYELLLVSGISLGPAGVGFARLEAPFVFKADRSFLDNPYFQVTTRTYHLRFKL